MKKSVLVCCLIGICQYLSGQSALTGISGAYFCGNDHFELTSRGVANVVKVEKEIGESFAVRFVPSELKSKKISIDLTTEKDSELKITQWYSGLHESESLVDYSHVGARKIRVNLDLSQQEYGSESEVLLMFYVNNTDKWYGDVRLVFNEINSHNNADMSQISVYPNIASDYISVSSNLEAGYCQIFDASGVLKLQCKQMNDSGKFDVDISALRSGNYLLVYSGNGQSQQVGFIKASN